MAQPQIGPWMVDYRSPLGQVVFWIDINGNIGLTSIQFPDGTIQTTASLGSGVDTVSSTSTSGGITVPANKSVLVLATGGAGGITLTLPSAVGLTGQRARVKKVDSGVGAVTINTTGGQTIDGASSYLLTNQNQYVVVESDGANWQIVGNN